MEENVNTPILTDEKKEEIVKYLDEMIPESQKIEDFFKKLASESVSFEDFIINISLWLEITDDTRKPFINMILRAAELSISNVKVTGKELIGGDNPTISQREQMAFLSKTKHASNRTKIPMTLLKNVIRKSVEYRNYEFIEQTKICDRLERSEQISREVEELDRIAQNADDLKDFLGRVAEKYPDFDALKNILVKWLNILKSNQKQYFLEVIDTAANSTIGSRDIKKLCWDDIDRSGRPLWYRNVLSEKIREKANEIGIKMKPIELISAIIQYHPQVKAKREQDQKQPRDSKTEVDPNKKNEPLPTRSDTEDYENWRPLTPDEIAMVAKMATEQQQMEVKAYKDEEKSIKDISDEFLKEKAKFEEKLSKTKNEAEVFKAKTELLDKLRQLSKKLSQYRRNHHMSVSVIMREIDEIINSISRNIKGTISNEWDVKSRILRNLCEGALDVEQAISDIEQVAQKACESIAGDNEKRIKLGARITPIGYKSKILIDIINSISNEPPIAEGIEDEVIHQLVQLGVSLQQATRSIVLNLINSQDYKRAQKLIDKYPIEERKAKERNAQGYDPETTQKVVENWNRMLINARSASSTKSEGKPKPEDERN